MPAARAIAKVAGKSTSHATSAAGAPASPKMGVGDQQLAAMGLKLGPDGRAYPIKADKPAADPAPAPKPALPSKSRARQTPSADPLEGPPTESRPLPAPSSGDGTISGFLLGLFGTAVFINFMRGGTPQVRKWVGAKFLNNTVAAPAAATPGGSGKSGLPGTGAPKPPAAGGGASGGGGGSW